MKQYLVVFDTHQTIRGDTKSVLYIRFFGHFLYTWRQLQFFLS